MWEVLGSNLLNLGFDPLALILIDLFLFASYIETPSQEHNKEINISFSFCPEF